MRRGWSTGTPRRSATTLAGVADRERPRPFSRSGCVTTAATSWPASSRASSDGTAKAPLPRNTTRTGPSSLLPVVGACLLAELALHQVPLERGQTVDEQKPVDMVDLVAERAREQLRPFIGPLLAVGVEALDDDALRPHRGAPEAGHGEAALVVTLLPLTQHELGIDQLDELALLLADGEVDHDDAQGHGDLRRGQADARGRVHRLDHVVEEPADRAVDLTDGLGGLVEHRVAVFHDGPDCHDSDASPLIKKLYWECVRVTTSAYSGTFLRERNSRQRRRVPSMCSSTSARLSPPNFS